MARVVYVHLSEFVNVWEKWFEGWKGERIFLVGEGLKVFVVYIGTFT